MRPQESPSLSVSRRGPKCLGSEPRRTVVWVRGEQDIANRTELCDVIGQAARLDNADIVVDLSGVTFMDASTIDTLVAARNGLEELFRSLFVRAPSPRARRLLDVCGLAELIDEQPTPPPQASTTALGSWVEVPAGDRRPSPAQPEVGAPVPDPVHATVRPREEFATQHRRSPA